MSRAEAPGGAMARLASVPVPRTVRYLRKDARGYPVPFIVMWDQAGTPHFPVNDAAKVARVLKHRACAICGRGLNGPGWFVGGPRSFLHPHGAFLDPPSHEECARYAVQVCPYIAAPSYARRIDGRKMDPNALPPNMAIVQTEGQDDRPPFFVMAASDGWTVRPAGPQGDVIVSLLPWQRMEVWRKGERVPEPEATRLLGDALEAIFAGGA